MGVISTIVGLGLRTRAVFGAITGVTRVLTGAGARAGSVSAGQAAEGHGQSLSDLVDRHVDRPTPGFRGFLDSLNNLPGPVVVVTTTLMIGFAMISPEAFSARMNGLNEVPEPLWWLMGGLISFYFGAREVRQARLRALVEAVAAAVLPGVFAEGEPAPPAQPSQAVGPVPLSDTFADNAALRDWAALRG